MSEANPFEGMPDGMWQAEWIALKLDASYPGVSDPGYLSAVKKSVVEILGDRSYTGRESANLRIYLDERGYSAERGFPDNPSGCKWPATVGSEGDLNAVDSRRRALELMMDRAFAERDSFQAKPTIDFSDLLASSLAKAKESYESGGELKRPPEGGTTCG